MVTFLLINEILLRETLKNNQEINQDSEFFFFKMAFTGTIYFTFVVTKHNETWRDLSQV